MSHTYLHWLSFLASFLCILMVGDRCLAEQPVPDPVLSFEELSPLPDQFGFGGMYAGVSNGALIVAGGANYPNKPFWEDGQKVWYDTIYLLPSRSGKWTVAAQRLPHKMGYGVSATYKGAMICAGGDNGANGLTDVFKLEYEHGRIEQTSLPPLPRPCTYTCGALLESTLYIAGGLEYPDAAEAMHTFWALDLSKPREQLHWESLPPWPGRARWAAIAAVQDGCFFLFSGMPMAADKDGKPKLTGPYFKDAYRYDPGKGGEAGVWRRIKDLPRPMAAGASPALPLGQSHIALLSGVDGSLLGTDPKTQRLPRDIYVYHTITNVWSKRGEIPDGRARTTVPTTWWGNGWVLPSGEASPGRRSPAVQLVKPASRPRLFGWFDWTVLVMYFASQALMGVYFSKREKGTTDYLLGGRRVPWWASGISMFGTQLSAITFMALPGVVYATDWVRFIGILMYLPAGLIAIRFFLPFFRRLNVTTAYEYLEKRFGVSVRVLSSALFILSQLARVAVVVYLPALALTAVTGMNVYVCIALMGLVSIFYTVMGGIEAVIWTDVVHVFVLMSGAALCLGIVIVNAGGLGNVLHSASSDGKFQILHWGWDVSQMVVWVMAIGTFFGVLSGFNSDQSTVQRFLTTPDEKSAARGILTSAMMSLVSAPIFYGLGTAMYVFYKNNPELLSPGRNDEIIPWFTVQQLPMGINGLVIAGIFAAAMSSLDGAMHSAATAYINDFHRRFRKGMSDHEALLIARIATAFFGVFGTLMSFWLVSGKIEAIFDTFAFLAGLLAGGLCGVFLLAVFTRRTSTWGALVGLATGAVFPWIISRTTNINIYLYPAIGTLSCVITGYFASLLLPADKHSIVGLTIFDLKPAIPGVTQTILKPDLALAGSE